MVITMGAFPREIVRPPAGGAYFLVFFGDPLVLSHTGVLNHSLCSESGIKLE